MKIVQNTCNCSEQDAREYPQREIDTLEKLKQDTKKLYK